MNLHVVVQDTQNRLGQVVVTDRDTGGNLGTLQANAQGSQVNGTVAVDPETEMFALDVKQKQSGNRLFQAGANLRAFRDVLVFSVGFGWEPNVGDEHAPCPAYRTTTVWGDPESLAGKTSVLDSVSRNACGGMPFENDQANAVNYQAKYNPLNLRILRNIGPPPAGLPTDGGPRVTAAIDAARLPYAGGQVFLQQFTALPFSKGVAHYPMKVTGEITSLLYFPYSGITSWRYESERQIGAQVREVASEAAGSDHPVLELVGKWEWGTVTTEVRKQVGSPEPIGDLWGLRASSTVTPCAHPCQPLTAPVTFELYGDQVPPSGLPGLIGGNGTATKTDIAWTTPPPPNPPQSELALTFPGQDPGKGTCTIQLAKGWRWKGVGSSMHYNQGEVGPFDVPAAGTKRITATLNLLLCLNLTTGTTPCQVELERQVGQAWQAVGSGNTSLQNGVQTWTKIENQPGLYRARAKRQTGPPPPQWGNWTEFQVAIGLVQNQPLSAP